MTPADRCEPVFQEKAGIEYRCIDGYNRTADHRHHTADASC